MGWLCATYLHERLRRQPACAGDEAAEKEMETKGRAADQGEKHVPVPEILVHAVAGTAGPNRRHDRCQKLRLDLSSR